MISNLWKEISIFCGCHGEGEVPLEPHAGSAAFAQGGVENSIFYSCPKYYPDNRTPEEKPCFNRLSIDEYEGMVLKLSETLEGADETGATVNLTGMQWKNRQGTAFRILSHDKKHGIRVSVVNRRAKQGPPA